MKTQTRKLIAIGDLHGDVYRLTRLLSEAGALDAETLRWTPAASSVDVILLGDYVDWRGELLEGPREEWPQGPRKVIELILNLADQQKQLALENQFQGCFHPLCGNHDWMMLESFEILEEFCRKDIGILERAPRIENLLQHLSSSSLALEEEEKLLRFLNWYQQGGDRTMESFGGLHGWMAAMGGRIGSFLKSLPLAVVVNQKLFCHSIPDSKEYWVPLDNHKTKSKEEYEKIREQYLWSRKVWGYDAFLGGKTTPFTEEEIDEMLAKLKVKGVVVGHTSLHQNAPYFHFGGKIINLDTHGIPGSQALVEEYDAFPRKKRISRRKTRAKRNE